MDPGRKITDQDIEEFPELIQLAVAYCVEYDGTFSYMLEAQNCVIESGELPPGVVRGVLNCMRRDPFARRLIE